MEKAIKIHFINNCLQYITLSVILLLQLGRRTDTRLPCAYRLVDGCLPVEVRTVALSTMCFVQTVGLETYTKRLNENFFRVCYSFHSSYSEIRDMILYLKPDQVFANVIPSYDDASGAQVCNYFSYILFNI